MGKLLYSAAMSLDGFIAGPDGDMAWLVPYLGPNPAVDELTGQIGALLVGRRTMQGDDPYKGTPAEGEAFGGAWSGPQFVLTHHPEAQAPMPDVTYVGDLQGGIAAAQAAAGSRYVNVLGASVAHQCLDAGLLDEIFVSIAPIMLGAGVRLFDYPGGKHVRLERLHTSHTPGATNLWFRVLRAST